MRTLRAQGEVRSLDAAAPRPQIGWPAGFDAPRQRECRSDASAAGTTDAILSKPFFAGAHLAAITAAFPYRPRFSARFVW
jgi:hypothetical protein